MPDLLLDVATPLPAAAPRYIRRVESLLCSVHFWWGVCLLLAGVHAWTFRHFMNPDGMSYLDMASETLRGGPQNLVNGYWSPAYPALIGLAFFIIRPSPIHEFPVIHLVNFAIFGFALLSFTFFLKSWLGVHRKPHMIPFCFCVFLWFTINFVTLSVVAPDLCMAGIVFLAAGICCRISLLGSDWRHFAALGGVLGLGYYVKAAMFPLGLTLIAVLFVWPPSRRHSRFKILLSAIVLLIVAAPLVTLVSRQVGHPTIGETGRLNYAWFTNGLRLNVGWTGGGEDLYGTPEHPPRTLPGKPTILEFANPIKGTYPLWYDPSYWYAGAKVRFDRRGQLGALKESLLYYREAFKQMAILFVGALLLLIAAGRKILAAPDRNFRWLFTWAIAACLMYTVVNAQSRYLGVFFVLSWLALYRLLWRRVENIVSVAVLGTVLCALLVSTTAPSLAAGAESVRDTIRSEQPDYLRIGAALQGAGVRRGDRLATVGYGLDAYYARYTGARITANIVDANEFRYLSAEDLGRVSERLARIGVKALVATDKPVHTDTGDWKDIIVSGSPRYSIMMVTPSASRVEGQPDQNQSGQRLQRSDSHQEPH